MNHMEEVARMFGVKMGERFKVNGVKYYISKEGLSGDAGGQWPVTLSHLLTGKEAVEKLPYKPKLGNPYWIVVDNDTKCRIWINDCIDLALYCAGYCFETEKDALEHAPKMLDKMQEKYEGENYDEKC